MVQTGVEEVNGAVRLEGGVIFTHWNCQDEVWRRRQIHILCNIEHVELVIWCDYCCIRTTEREDFELLVKHCSATYLCKHFCTHVTHCIE